MPARLVEIVVPEEQSREVESLVGRHEPIAAWSQPADAERASWKLLVTSDRLERILDAIEDRFGNGAEFRVVVTPVEAVLPRPEVDAPSDGAEPQPESPPEEKKERRYGWSRISREELYHDIAAGTALTPIFFIEVAIATIIAAVGLQRDLPAVTIAAMVIAPLLGPNMALGLATTLGDIKLGRQSLLTNGAGVALAFAVAFGIGLIWTVDLEAGEIGARTQVEFSDVALALCAGVAGALSFTSGISSALVGVMVAVALLPPLVVFAMLVGAAKWGLAGEAGVLLATNIVCVNLASVVTFAAQGIRPRTWWEAERSRRATRFALLFWSVLLVVLVALIWLVQGGAEGGQ